MGGDITAVINAGLPNITAQMQYVGRSTGLRTNFETGAFSFQHTSFNRQMGSDYSSGILNFDASKSNEIYGKSDKVLPESFALVAQIKY